MHIHSLHQRQCQIVIMLKHTDRTVGADDVFQYLQDGAARQLAQGKVERHLYLLPQHGKQGHEVQRPFGQLTVILEENILDAGVMGVEQHV